MMKNIMTVTILVSSLFVGSVDAKVAKPSSKQGPNGLQKNIGVTCQQPELRSLIKQVNNKRLMSVALEQSYNETAKSFADLGKESRNYAIASTALATAATLGGGFIAGTAAAGTSTLFLGGSGVGAGLWNAFFAVPAYLYSGFVGSSIAAAPVLFGVIRIEKIEDAIKALEQAKVDTESAQRLSDVVDDTKSGLRNLKSFLANAHGSIDAASDELQEKLPRQYYPAWFLSFGWSDAAMVKIERIRAEAHAKVYAEEVQLYSAIQKWAISMCK